MKRFRLFLSASAALAASLSVSTAGSAEAQASKTISPLQGEASRNYSPAIRQIAFRPVSRQTFPQDLLASLTQSAVSRKVPDPPIQNTSMLKATGKAIRQFYPDQINYRPARSAAQSFLKEEAPDKKTRSQEEIQKQRDQIYLHVAAAMLDMARGLGEEQADSAAASQPAALRSGFQRLSAVVGEPEAKWALSRLKDWSSHLSFSVLTPDDGPLEEFDGAEELARQAIQNDWQVRNMKETIAKYDVMPSNAERVLTTLSFIPVAAAPIATVTESGVEMSRGGSRDQRLADVITLGLKLQSRTNLLTRESYLAISQIHRARREKNQVLFAFATDLANRLKGQ